MIILCGRVLFFTGLFYKPKEIKANFVNLINSINLINKSTLIELIELIFLRYPLKNIIFPIVLLYNKPIK